MQMPSSYFSFLLPSNKQKKNHKRNHSGLALQSSYYAFAYPYTNTSSNLLQFVTLTLILQVLVVFNPNPKSLAFAFATPQNKNINNNNKMQPRTSLLSNEPDSIQSLVKDAQSLYQSTFGNRYQHETEDLVCTVAPGRVNLIGEHTDYTQGFVFPMAIEYSTVCVGRGCIHKAPVSTCEIVSLNQKPNPKVISFQAKKGMIPLPFSDQDSWSNYVAGVVQRYMDDVLNLKHHSGVEETEQYSISFQIAVNGNVPLGSGLSSSAALEVAIATFIEKLLEKSKHLERTISVGGVKEKALLCQKAENIFCNSPCGIMDQYVSAAGKTGSALLIDCRSLEYENVELGSKVVDDIENDDEREEKKDNTFTNNSSSTSGKKSKPVFVICNSNVTHSIGGGEYPKRVEQCKIATKILSDLHGERIASLRDASLGDVEMAAKKRGIEGASDVDEIHSLMDDLIYRRAKHVVTENQRTQNAKVALLEGDWETFGILMNESHESMKKDYEVSCEEIDVLVELAQNHPGTYGSRLTGGGFGGCTVTLVEKDSVESLCRYLKEGYKARTGKECFCFETLPGDGAREIIL